MEKRPIKKKTIALLFTIFLLLLVFGTVLFFFLTQNNVPSTEQATSTVPQQTSGKHTDMSAAESVADDTDFSAETSPTEDTPFRINGALHVDGSALVNQNGEPFQLKGVSTHGINWFPDYVSHDTFSFIRDEWNANLIRLAMYSADYNGYCTGSEENRTALKELVYSGIDACTELGLYTIVDWHTLSDNNPNTYLNESIAFFDEISRQYKDNDNILYEICNEPNGSTSWSDIKAYALQIIPVIRANDSNAVIIVGTPTWSQDVDAAAADPITEYDNIMYTLHFYAATHTDWLRQRMNAAVDNNLPVIVTEFGICDASGNGGNNLTEGNNWIAAMDAKNISYCIWNLSNKAETAALIASDCTKTSGWTKEELSEAGKWYVGVLSSSK